MHVHCEELVIKYTRSLTRHIIIILLIIFLRFIKLIANNKSEKDSVPCMGFELGSQHSATADVIINSPTP